MQEITVDESKFFKFNINNNKREKTIAYINIHYYYYYFKRMDGNPTNQVN